MGLNSKFWISLKKTVAFNCVLSVILFSKSPTFSEDYLFSLCVFHIHLIGLFRVAFCGEFLKELEKNIPTTNPHCVTEV